jgi:hypothetical protein
MEEISPALLELFGQLGDALQDCDVYYDGPLCDEVSSFFRTPLDSGGQGVAGENGFLALVCGGPRPRAALMLGFSRLAVVDAALAVSPNSGFDFSDFLGVVAHAIVDALRLHLDAEELHPEELAQLLKDESRMLFCFLSVDLLSDTNFQRLRGIGFTQTDHRILFCGHSRILDERSSRLVRGYDEDGPQESRHVRTVHSPSASIGRTR